MNKRISDEDLNMLIDRYFPKVDRLSHVIYWAAVAGCGSNCKND